MKITRALSPFACLLVACAFATPAAAACQLREFVRVKVEITDSGSVLVPVTVNDTPVWMLLHLSSGVPMAYETTVQQVGLRTFPAESPVVRVAGTNLARQTEVDRIRIGGATFTRWTMNVLPATAGTAPIVEGKPVLGSLSSRFLATVDMELNLAEQEIALFEHARCGEESAHWGGVVTSANLFDDGTGLLMFPIEIDGRRVEASLNTNESSSVISEAVTDRYFGFNRNSSGVERNAQPGDETASYRAMALTTRGLQMNNVRVRLNEDLQAGCDPRPGQRDSNAIGFARCGSTSPLSIGTHLLRKLRIYVAPIEGRIYFTRAGDAAASQ